MLTPAAPSMKIVLVGSLAPSDNTRYRLSAFGRLGHTVVPFDVARELPALPRLLHWVRERALFGPGITRFNRRLVEFVRRERPDLVWLDRVVYVRAETVRAIEALGARAVHNNPDNPFGPRGDPWWRLFLEAVPHHSAIVSANPLAVPHYTALGAPLALWHPCSFSREDHFAPPQGWSDRDRTVDVAFIGTPYDDRPRFLVDLFRRHGIATAVRGQRWRRTALYRLAPQLLAGGPLLGADYREAFWRARIALGFVTRSNLDVTAHRWFEIAGCGAFLLAERTAATGEYFEEDREAVFFSGVDECAAKIRRYLPDEAARARIAQAGRERAVRSGYDYDGGMKRVLDQIASRYF